jgi:Histidine kinase
LGSQPRAPVVETAAWAWQVCRSTTRREWAWVLGIALVIVLVSLPQRLDLIGRLGWNARSMAVDFLVPLYVSALMFLGYALAEATPGDDRARRRRLVVALCGAGALATVSAVGVWYLAGSAELWAQHAARLGKPHPSPLLVLLTEYLNVLIVGGMVYALAEVMRRGRTTQQALESTLGQQVALEQQVLESRLAAMQAQVEPRFLFDTLVDIEALYQRDAPRAAANLDRLIGYLRAALPRLRESGSTVEAELALVQAYLDVVTALHDGLPQLSIAVEAGCGAERFYPMLLLPLVQRAVRHPTGRLPDRIAVEVKRDGGRTVVTLRIAMAGGCADDDELARVRERLAGLYGSAAQLDCTELDGQTTLLRLRLPAAGHAMPTA